MSELETAWRVWSTIRTLVTDRHYEIPEEYIKIQTFEDWKKKFVSTSDDEEPFYYSNLDTLYNITLKGKEKYGTSLLCDQLYVVWTNDEKLNLKFINDLTLKMKVDKVYQALILYGNGLTDRAKREISYPTIYGEGSINTVTESSPPINLRIETLQRDSYIINITHHKIQPKFELISQTEKEKVLILLKTEANKLPRMHSTDPIARYYGLIRGQILKITRANEIITYRIVY